MPKLNNHIPDQYQKYWRPFHTNEVLFHITTSSNLEDIRKHGLTPRDPSPKHWKGLKAIFMTYPKDPLYEETQKHVLAHVQEKGEQLVRLHVRTKNKLYRSIDPERTFQVISLDPIGPHEIIKVEQLNTS